MLKTGHVFGFKKNNFRVSLVAFCRFILIYIFNKPEIGIKAGVGALEAAEVGVEVLSSIKALLASLSLLVKGRLQQMYSPTTLLA